MDTATLLADVVACRKLVDDYAKRIDDACVEYHETGKYQFPNLSRAEDEDMDQRCELVLKNVASIAPEALNHWKAIKYDRHPEQIVGMRDVWIRRRNLFRALESSLETRFKLVAASQAQENKPREESGMSEPERRGALLSTPGGFLAEAVRRIPAVAWAMGVGGVVAVAAIIGVWKSSPAGLVFGSLGLFVGMFGLLLFSSLVAPAQVKKAPLVSLFMLWAFAVLLVACGFLAASSVFFDKPIPLGTMLLPVKPPDGSSSNLPRLFVLAVGVNDYGHLASNRQSSVTAANAVANALSLQKNRAFSDVQTAVLTASAATQRNVLAALAKWGQGASTDDLAVAFFSGRAGHARPGRYAFMCFGSDYHEPERTGISGQTLIDFCSRVPCPKLLIIDTGTHGGIYPQKDRDATSEVEVQRQAALAVIVTSWDGEASLESDAGQNRFTKSFLEALDVAGDQNHDGVVTFAEVWDYLLKNGPKGVACGTPPNFRELNPQTVLARTAP